MIVKLNTDCFKVTTKSPRIDKENNGNRARIIDYRVKHPELTLLEIGNRVGVSRERVRQVLTSEQLETKSLKRQPPVFPKCKKCETRVPTRNRIYCSDECKKTEKTIPCAYCQKEMSFRISIYNARNRSIKQHCSRECYYLSRKGTTMRKYRE